jgi:L-2-hydroxycarboxylate dehydrogenase (NAD+)
MQIERDRAESVAAAALETHGITSSAARLTSRVLVTADAMGKHSHGLLRLPRFVRGIEHDNVNPHGDIEVVRDAGAAATLSGGSRLGPVVASEAIAEAMARAEEFGVGVVGTHDANHLGMLGYYTDRVRREEYIALAMTNTEPAMPPYGGTSSILGTNPIAIGIPTEPPFDLDMSTSAIARGTVLHKREQGDELPEGVALDSAGQPTTDPDAALDGVIKPFGGVKGSGFAIAIEMLAGGLVGAAMGTDVTGTYHTENPCTKGDFFIVIDPEALGGQDATERMSAFLRDLKTSETAAGVDEIRLPGEKSIARADTDEVEIDDEIWTDICDLAHS